VRMTKFLTIGRVLYDKGYKELVEASKIIRRDNPDVEFHWLGPIDESYPAHVPLEKVLEDQENGDIVYHDFSNDVISFLKGADCIILPSYHEGMSRTLMEALAVSRPVITSDIPGCREAVDEGVNGFLCEARNSASLVEAIKCFLKLSEEERRAMCENSRKKAESRFDVKKVISVYDAILSKLKK